MIDPVFFSFLTVSLAWPAAAAFVLWDTNRRAAPALRWWLLTLLTGPVGLMIWLYRRRLSGPPLPGAQELIADLQR